MTFPSLFQKGKKMSTNAGQAGGATSDPANPIWTLLVWKLKTAAVLFLHIVALQGRYRARNRRVGTWYVNTFSSSVMYGTAPTGQHLMEVGLSRPPYLPQTVSKEQSSRKGGKRGGAGGGVESHRSKSHRTVAGVRLTPPGSRSRSLHLDRKNAVYSDSPLLLSFRSVLFSE